MSCNKAEILEHLGRTELKTLALTTVIYIELATCMALY